MAKQASPPPETRPTTNRKPQPSIQETKTTHTAQPSSKGNSKTNTSVFKIAGNH
jgi:hypothetical protein